MCSGCNLKNGESVKLISNSNTEFQIDIENAGGTFRLHMTNNVHHTIREIYYCPFCGRNLRRNKK